MIVFVLAASASLWAHAEALPPVIVHVPKGCLACNEWAKHLRRQGFTVTLEDSLDPATLKRQPRMPRDFKSRHTAVVAGYSIEEHVPAEDLEAPLREKAKALGLTVPGLPRGAPGLDLAVASAPESVHKGQCFAKFVTGRDVADKAVRADWRGGGRYAPAGRWQ